MAKRQKPITGQAVKAAAPNFAEGHNIQNWRLFRGIETQTELSRLTKLHDKTGKGIERFVISRLEKGERRYNQDQLELLAQALGVTPRDLVGTNPFNAGDIFAVYAGLTDAEKQRALFALRRLKGE